MERVVITGVAGGLGRLLARRLRQAHEVTGVDREPWTTRPAGTPFHQVDVRQRAFEDVLRKLQPTAVVHLGFVRHFRGSAGARYDLNVRGTRKVLELCRDHGVAECVVLSSSYVYGARPENPNFMGEDHPLSGSRDYPEIRDLVEVDTLASGFMWRHPELRTCVLRPVPTLGRYYSTSIGTYLRMGRPVTMLGFNPMMQFLHEEDLCEAVALAVEKGLRGVYNVAGPGEVPLHTALHEIGARPLPVPEFVARPLLESLFRAGWFPFPAGAIDYVKYPCTIDGRRFAEATGFRPQYSLAEIFRGIRRA